MECLVRDIPVHYEVRGDGRPILMLHGFTPDHRLMLGCMEPLFQVQDGWQRIYLDLPGMGRTPGPDWLTSTDQMLDVVLEFVKRVLPQQHYCVAGESYGGYLAQGLVLRDSSAIEGVFQLCPVVIADAPRRHIPAHVVLEQEPGLLSQLTDQERAEFEPMAVIQNNDTWQKFKRDILCGLTVADQEFLERLRTTSYGFADEIALEQVRCDKPVLIIVGRQDSIVGYEDAWKLNSCYPHATFAVIDRAGHNLQIEQTSLFSALVLEWLTRVERGWGKN